MSVPLSRIKREKLRKLERLEARERLRASLPVLTRDDIRKFRLPYHQAIQEELNEKGFVSSAEFIRQLLEHQAAYHESHAYDFVIQSRPMLIDSSENLERLSNALRTAEENHYNLNTNGELDSLLALADYYAFGTSDWWWLAEQIFTQCMLISEDYLDDYGLRKAECRYIYGKYLVEQDLDPPRGIDLLNEARDLSEGFIWSAAKLTNRPQQTVFVETCTIIYNTLIKQIKGLYVSHPEEALEICVIARKRGADACIPKADIAFLQGKCEMEANKAHLAVDSFRKAQLLYKNQGMIPGSCEARIYLALAYLEIGKWERAYEELEKLLVFATENGLDKYEALSYTYMGLYYLNQGTPEKATLVLEKAMDIFHELNDVANREFVKNLACVSKGQETISRYTDLILACETRNVEKNGRNLLRLVRWKDSREPFSEDMSESSMSVSVGEEETVAEESLGTRDEVVFEEDVSEEEIAFDDQEIMTQNLDL